MSITDLRQPLALDPELPATPPPRRPRHGSVPRSARTTTIIVGVALTVGAAITALPFFWMVFSSVKPRSESVAYPPALLPREPTFEFYVQLFQELDFGRYVLNTLAIVLISMIGLLLMAMAGYGFAKFTFRGREPLFFLVLITMMIPVQVTMIPTYLILNGMKLTNTLIGIALPTLVSGFSIFLFRQFMSTIPTEILEAARIDGASEMRIFLRIVLPMSRPIMAVQIVLTFIAGWNSFLWPLILANDERLYTLSVGVSLLNQQIATNPSLQMAAATLMVVPILIVFVIFQRSVVQGFALSGLK
ncbi:carbohydrate ABC transporter permease [Microbacterium sp. ABRD28]|uniref:carbohydrate ABC transporter permease n=1 Tax=Microbacterium sp. ABRD28 TaxID=2268461 RepID=UPI000F558AFA|nr:carbohydrate ABC transporter permease [Microbacterium sp. ABRD28]AZC12355.1 carbohydrate ABC transporter permease [Microbacterium sp. ABRD28]